MRDALLFVTSFFASSVEMVEALTIVVAVGVTRGWRSALLGVLAALAALAVVVASLGPALTLVPLHVLRLVVGGLLLVFGLQWLRKAILRASGSRPLHDEDAIYRVELEEARHAPNARDTNIDWYSFTIACKGVLLEGLEVAFIVVTFGSSQHNIPLAAAAAGGAFVLVALIGAAVHRPLSRVPENALKFGVGVMLTSFGTFWGSEGAGVHWPAGDASLLGVLAFTVLVSVGLSALFRQQAPAAQRGALTH